MKNAGGRPGGGARPVGGAGRGSQHPLRGVDSVDHGRAQGHDGQDGRGTTVPRPAGWSSASSLVKPRGGSYWTPHLSANRSVSPPVQSGFEQLDAALEVFHKAARSPIARRRDDSSVIAGGLQPASAAFTSRPGSTISSMQSSVLSSSSREAPARIPRNSLRVRGEMIVAVTAG